MNDIPAAKRSLLSARDISQLVRRMNRLQTGIALNPPPNLTLEDNRFARLGIWVPSRREQRECERERERERERRREPGRNENGQIDEEDGQNF